MQMRSFYIYIISFSFCNILLPSYIFKYLKQRSCTNLNHQIIKNCVLSRFFPSVKQSLCSTIHFTLKTHNHQCRCTLFSYEPQTFYLLFSSLFFHNCLLSYHCNQYKQLMYHIHNLYFEQKMANSLLRWEQMMLKHNIYTLLCIESIGLHDIWILFKIS